VGSKKPVGVEVLTEGVGNEVRSLKMKGRGGIGGRVESRKKKVEGEKEEWGVGSELNEERKTKDERRGRGGGRK
jgi:hypothetical protein